MKNFLQIYVELFIFFFVIFCHEPRMCPTLYYQDITVLIFVSYHRVITFI